jgi:hypothetical protein
MHTMSTPTTAAPAATGRRLTRWGTRAAFAAPVLAVFAIGVGAPIYADDLSDAAVTARFAIANAVTLGVLMALSLALVGFYLRAEGRLTFTGEAGFVVALLGTILAAGGAWDSLFAVPYVADKAPSVLDDPTGGSLLAGFFLSYLVFVIGWVLFASAGLRARIASKRASIVLIAGSVLAILPAPTALRLLPLTIGVALVARSAR